jgi:putative hydrolase of the HAD superfamily
MKYNMVATAYKHIIFDFGGVFLDLGGRSTDVPQSLAKIFKIREEQAASIWEANKEVIQTGKEAPEQFLQRMGKELGAKVDIERANVWSNHARMDRKQINWGLVDYIKLLKNDYKIHMLSNVIDLKQKPEEWVLELDGHFDTIFRSHAIGFRKPNSDIFLYVLSEISAKPGECIFVDDTQRNVDAANGLGIKGVLYTSLDQLKKDFAGLGVSVRERSRMLR